MLFPENIGPHLSIDEVSLSKGELYTFVTNKKGRGRKSTLVASIRGTRSRDILRVLERIPLERRRQVLEVTLDMAKNIESATKLAFPESRLVTDRFHVVRLATESLQHLRIKLRWRELDIENRAVLKAKSEGVRYRPAVLSNGDTPKQLLARSRYIIAKKMHQWTGNQKKRAQLLFKRYPELEQAYGRTIEFRNIYELRNKIEARRGFEKWTENIYKDKNNTFYTTANTVKANLENILNFFNNRNTNANAESFNAKIKLFRANLRGVTDTNFFLFRLHKLFA